MVSCGVYRVHARAAEVRVLCTLPILHPCTLPTMDSIQKAIEDLDLYKQGAPLSYSRIAKKYNLVGSTLAPRYKVDVRHTSLPTSTPLATRDEVYTTHQKRSSRNVSHIHMKLYVNLRHLWLAESFQKSVLPASSTETQSISYHACRQGWTVIAIKLIQKQSSAFF